MFAFLSKSKKEKKKKALVPPYSYVTSEILKSYRTMMKTMEKKGINGFTNREHVGEAVISYQGETFYLKVGLLNVVVKIKNEDEWITLLNYNALHDINLAWEFQDTQKGRLGKLFFEDFPNIIDDLDREWNEQAKTFLNR